jgi:hypothetical protein
MAYLLSHFLSQTKEEYMMEFLLSVLSSIIGNLLTPSFKDWIGLDESHQIPQSQPNRRPDPASEEALEQRRRFVRQQWEIYSWTVFVLFVLIFFVGVALAMPVALKTGFFADPLRCADVRAINLCDGSYWNPDSIKIMLIPLGILCAMVIWFLAQSLANPIAQYVHHDWRPVGPILYRRILSLTIMLLAFLLCGHWTYFLFPHYSYWTALLLPFFIVGMVGVMMSRR